MSATLLQSAAERYVQPIIYSTLSTEGIKNLVTREYAIDEPVECTFVSRSVSDTYRLSTPANRFALKVYRTNWRAREDIEWELAALRHVRARGVDVAMPVQRRDGDFITELQAPEGLRAAVMFHWARGHAPKYANSEHAREYGSLLARLHNAGDDLVENPLRAPMDFQYLLEDPLARIRTRLPDVPSVAPKLAALEQRIRSRCRAAQPYLLDWGFCHGDIWTNNARVNGNRLVLFDFDFSGSGWHLFDLASYRWDAYRKGAEPHAWPAFIEGYLSVRPIAADSLDYIGLFMVLKALWTAAFFIDRSTETGSNFLSDEDLEGLVPFCERIEAELG